MKNKSPHAKSLERTLYALANCRHKQEIQAIYLYGSCARCQQTKNSDVDLFICLNKLNPRIQRELRAIVESDDLALPEVELKFGTKLDLLHNDNIFYRNIRKEGKLLWERQKK